MYNYDDPAQLQEVHNKRVSHISHMLMHETREVPYIGVDEITFMEIVRVPSGLIYHTYEQTDVDDEGYPLSYTLKTSVFVPYDNFTRP